MDTHTITALQQHALEASQWHLRTLFEQDPLRFQNMSIRSCGLLLDYSKNHVTAHTMRLLWDFAHACHIHTHIEHMCEGKPINTTEQRAVLHTALRQPSSAQVDVNGHNTVPLVHHMLHHMERFVHNIHQGMLTGYSGKPFTDVVNIGIGGSDLGPRMVTEALKPYHTHHVKVHFVSNVDPSDLLETLRFLNPETTLFVVASKTFTTQETMANANAAKRWMQQAHPTETHLKKHFVGVSSNTRAAVAWGVSSDQVFEIWDWVGGRYSLWSSIGLPIALAIGMEAFKQLLQGAHAMDVHMRTQPFEHNMAVTLALIGFWNISFLHRTLLAVLPYSQLLHRLPAYLQQLDMESNGKSTTLEGVPVTYHTGPLVFGEPGTNGQHAFYQWLHQGNTLVPCDFIGYASTPYPSHAEEHRVLLAHMLAQSQALMQGKPNATHPHKKFLGNRPSNTLLLDTLSPYTLGALLALYEAKVAIQGFLWNINSFDQWGVELGKELAQHTLHALQTGTPNPSFDSSTYGLSASIIHAHAAPNAPA